MHAARFLLIGVAALTTTACQTVQTTQPGAVGVERKQHMLLSEENVEKGAQEAYRQELEKARQQGALNTDQQAYKRVQAISQRLIPHTAIFRLELMARAGYDPNASITLWQKMAKLGGGTPEFLSTHPSGESRIRDLETNIPRVLPLYQAAKK